MSYVGIFEFTQTLKQSPNDQLYVGLFDLCARPDMSIITKMEIYMEVEYYIKPEVHYWTALQLNEIEARMSHCTGNGLSTLERFINRITNAITYSIEVYNIIISQAEQLVVSIMQAVEAAGFTNGYALAHGYDYWSRLNTEATVLRIELDVLSLGIATYNYNYNTTELSPHIYEYAFNQCNSNNLGWAAYYAYGMNLDLLYKLKTNSLLTVSSTMERNGCEVIACYNVLLYIYYKDPVSYYNVYESLADLAYYFELNGSILYGVFGTFIDYVVARLDFLLKDRINEEWGAVLYHDKTVSEYDAIFADCSVGILSYFGTGGDLITIHTIMIYKKVLNNTLVIKTYNCFNDDGYYANDSNSAYCFSSIQDLVTRYGYTPVSLICVTAPAGAL